MNTDLVLVIGVILAWLAIPSMISAFIDQRPPRVATIVVVLGGALILLALTLRPGGYTWDDVTGAFMNVYAMVLR